MSAEEQEESPAEDGLRLLSTPNYRRWFFADTAEAAGAGLRRFAVPLVAVSLAGPAAAGVMAGTMDALNLGAMLVGGLVADRYARRRVVLATAPVTLAVWGLAAIAAALGFLSFPLLFVLACLSVLAAGVGHSAGEAILRNIVPTDKYPRAISLNSGRDAAIEIGAGPLGGVVLAVSTALPFAANAVATAVRIIGFTRIDLDESERLRVTQKQEKARLAALLAEALAGMRWILARPLTRTLALGAVLLNVGFQSIVQTLVFDYQQQGITTALIGLISAGMAVGVVLGSLVAGRLVEGVRTGIILPVTFGWLLLTAILLAVTDSVFVSAGILVLTGLVLPGLNSASFGFLMVAAPLDHQGRVFSGQNVLGMAATPIGLALAGFALDVWGRQPTMYAALVPLILGASAMVLSRGVRRLPASTRWKDFVAAEPGLG